MLLWPWKLADALGRDEVSERAKGAFLVAYLLLPFSFPGVRLQVADWRWVVAVLAITLLFLVLAFRANGGARGRHLIERYVCLHTPVMVGAWLVASASTTLLPATGVTPETAFDEAIRRRAELLQYAPWTIATTVYAVAMLYFLRRAASPPPRVPA